MLWPSQKGGQNLGHSVHLLDVGSKGLAAKETYSSAEHYN